MAEHERFGRKEKERAREIDCFVKLYEQQDRFLSLFELWSWEKKKEKMQQREKLERKKSTANPCSFFTLVSVYYQVLRSFKKRREKGDKTRWILRLFFCLSVSLWKKEIMLLRKKTRFSLLMNRLKICIIHMICIQSSIIIKDSIHSSWECLMNVNHNDFSIYSGQRYIFM